MKKIRQHMFLNDGTWVLFLSFHCILSASMILLTPEQKYLEIVLTNDSLLPVILIVCVSYLRWNHCKIFFKKLLVHVYNELALVKVACN